MRPGAAVMVTVATEDEGEHTLVVTPDHDQTVGDPARVNVKIVETPNNGFTKEERHMVAGAVAKVDHGWKVTDYRKNEVIYLVKSIETP